VTSGGDRHPAVPRGLPRPGGRLAARHSRTILAGILLAVIFAGIGAAGLPAYQPGPWHADAGLIALAVEVVLAVLLLILRSIRQRSPQPGYPADRLRLVLHRTLRTTMGVVAALVVTGLVWPGLKTYYGNPAVLVPTFRSQPIPYIRHPFGGLSRAEIGIIGYSALALVLLLVAAGSVALLRRRRAALPAAEQAADETAKLRQAVDSGLQALQSVTDSRRAVFACYLAMETSLRTAGVARGVGETPDELLGRAVSSGLLRGGAARQLTALFSEARYSSHELPAAARDRAAQALAEIHGELSQPAAAAGTGGPSAAGAGPDGSGGALAGPES